jgi:hypothetical protein
MKLTRILATGAAAALVGVSTLAIGGSAAADDFYVDDADFVAEVSPYPNQWFTGNVTTPGTMTSTASGLSFTGDFQILNGDTPTTGLVGLVADAQFNVVSGEMAFQIPIFANGTDDSGYTTLVPVDPGNAGLHRADDGWTSTNDILADDGITILIEGGNSQIGPYYSLQDIESALDSLTEPYEILAFGAFLPATTSAVVSHITWAGDTHWFLPAPTATVTPASLTIDEMEATGVSGVFTGYLPGETVEGYLATSGGGGPIPGTFTADANGSVTVTHSVAGLTAGTYFLGAIGNSSSVSTSGSFAVTANPAELADTGADFTPQIVTGSALMLVGAAFVVAARRRAITKRH